MKKEKGLTFYIALIFCLVCPAVLGYTIMDCNNYDKGGIIGGTVLAISAWVLMLSAIFYTPDNK